MKPSLPALRVKAMLVKRFSIRLHMLMILTSVMTFGLVLSAVLRWLGLHSIIFRYPLVIVCSYVFFFFAVRVWLLYVLPAMRNRSSKSSLSGTDFPSFDGDISSAPSAPSSPSGLSGGGGSFSGGGASGNWAETGAAVQADLPAASQSASSGGGILSDVGDIDIDGAGAVAILAVAVIILVLLGSSAYLIYQAPVILSEAAFNAMLSGGLIRVSRKMPSENWEGTIFRSTWIPFAVILIITCIGAFVIHALFPGAVSIPDLFRNYIFTSQH